MTAPKPFALDSAAIVDAPEPAADAEPAAEADVTETVERLAAAIFAQDAPRAARLEPVETLGLALQRDAAHRARMVQAPIGALAEHGAEGGVVAAALGALNAEVSALDPNATNLSGGWLDRLFGGEEAALTRYFAQFEGAEPALDAALAKLENARETLRRDLIVLAEDEAALGAALKTLDGEIAVGEALDARLSAALGGEGGDAGLVEEAQATLRRRLRDLRLHRAVLRQGLLSIAVIARNNRELMRGADHARDVTLSALRIAMATAAATTRQKLALAKLAAARDEAADAARRTAAGLRAADEAALSGAADPLAALKSAFRDLLGAMDEIERHQRESTPAIAERVAAFAADSAAPADAPPRS